MAEEEYEYKGIRTGSELIQTTEAIIASYGLVIPALTPLVMERGNLGNEYGKLKPWTQAGFNTAEYINLQEIPADNGDITTQVIKSGTLDIDQINWSLVSVTEQDKRIAFTRSPISLQKAG